MHPIAVPAIAPESSPRVVEARAAAVILIGIGGDDRAHALALVAADTTAQSVVDARFFTGVDRNRALLAVDAFEYVQRLAVERGLLVDLYINSSVVQGWLARQRNLVGPVFQRSRGGRDPYPCRACLRRALGGSARGPGRIHCTQCQTQRTDTDSRFGLPTGQLFAFPSEICRASGLAAHLKDGDPPQLLRVSRPRPQISRLRPPSRTRPSPPRSAARSLCESPRKHPRQHCVAPPPPTDRQPR